MKYILTVIVALGFLFSTQEAQAHSRGEDIAIGAAALIAGAIASRHRHRHHYYDDYCDLYPYACYSKYRAPRYRYYEPRRYYKHHRRYDRHRHRHH